ncbi:ribonuclease VapC37 [Marmoricola endophyticus]|uniref:Ribonuclease VapC n=1 Tax=Marmoricola endophyticus TaxID=2040280 RepID=A0A917BAW1_9ACTN|nr:type II toxin-antitoxin system VapC family toxin [Marmoricola endophyticus]GGF34516.1 ribonuclease VapC37 [Marmoricola endophyticus]
MKIVDANVLIYAVNPSTTHHEASRTWLDRSLSGDEVVGFSWLVLLAFVRLSTKRGLFPRPLTSEQALELVDAWLTAPSARLLHPDAGHVRSPARLLDHAGGAGDLVDDAHLAALAEQHRAGAVTYDQDFGRFGDVRWHRPDDLLG